MFPCTSCAKHGRKCIVRPQYSARCSECVWKGFNCDVESIGPSIWSALYREESRIEQEKKDTFAKLLRLERQEDRLQKRSLAILRRRLRTLDELDEAEAKEWKEMEESQKAEDESRPVAAAASEAPSDFTIFSKVQNKIMSTSDPISRRAIGVCTDQDQTVGEVSPDVEPSTPVSDDALDYNYVDGCKITDPAIWYSRVATRFLAVTWKNDHRGRATRPC